LGVESKTIAPAVGRVDAKQNKQGNANNQRLDITLTQLDPNTRYQLPAVNGGVVDTNIADTNGRLSFTHLPVSPADILLVRELAIWDSVGNNILSTQLP
jgi:hypothetical protein